MSREEKTETIYGVDNTISVSLECFARVKERHDSCGDDRLSSVIIMTNLYCELLSKDDLLVARMCMTVLASFAILHTPIPRLNRSFFPLRGMIQW